MTTQTAGKTFKYLWIGAIGWVMVLNIQPYLALVTRLSQQIVSVPFWPILKPIPLVGPFLGLIGLIIPALVAIAIYLLIQLLQCLPMLLGSPEQLRAQIAAGERWSGVSIHDNEPRWLLTLKERLNNFPLLWIERIHNGSKIAYAIDFVLAGTQFPLFKDGWIDAVKNWNSLDLGDVLWANVPSFLVMVFALEACVWLFLKLSEGFDILHGGGGGGAPKSKQRTQDQQSW